MSDSWHKWETQSDTFWHFSWLMRMASIGKEGCLSSAAVTEEHASRSSKIGWRTENTCALLLGVQIGYYYGKGTSKIKNGITIWSRNCTSGYYPKMTIRY